MVHYTGSKTYRNMDEIETPEFRAPTYQRTFMRGNNECDCNCHTKLLPRNVLLIRPKRQNEKLSENLYELFEHAWNRGELQRLSGGSCQTAIRKDTIKRIFGEFLSSQDLVQNLLNNTTIKCVDNKDNSELQKGDIVLERVGSNKSVGKPHLILE